MPGSRTVNKNILLWSKAVEKALRKLVEQHVTVSEMYAKAYHPWHTQTGGTDKDFYHDTFVQGSKIIGDVGYKSSPSKEGSKGYWLENPNRNVRAYGHGAPFGTRFQILEEARDHDINLFISKARAIMRGKYNIYAIGTMFGFEKNSIGNPAQLCGLQRKYS